MAEVADDRVVAGAAVEEVVAGGAVEEVVAAVAEQAVVTLLAVELVVGGTADERVAAASAVRHARRAVEHDAVGAGGALTGCVGRRGDQEADGRGDGEEAQGTSDRKRHLPSRSAP